MWFYRFYPFTTGGVVTPPPAPLPDAPLFGGGGYLPSVSKRRRDFLKRLGIPDEEEKIIEQVAQRQVETLDLDDLKRTEELYRELKLEGIEAEARHFEALVELREQLIEVEIGKLLRKKVEEEEEAMVLILIAAYLT